MLTLCTRLAGLSFECGPLLSFRRGLHLTSVVAAEPMKKKKRMDPGLLMAREQRSKRRLEKAIRRLEKAARKLKPIDEIIGDYKLQRTKR